MSALTRIISTPAEAAATSPLDRACTRQPGVACQLMWDVSHNEHLARVTRVFFAGPVEVLLRILFVILIALVIRFLAGRLIRRVVRGAANENGSGRVHSLLGDRRQQRATALGSVLGNVATITIFTIATFIILGDLGLNLAPVLASAGVIGIAIGFGAQNLVQDFLAGIFMLMEDQYGVGDVISIGTVSGTVEAVSLRITRVRDVNGVIWHIRNGTISQSGNESHGWARAVVDYPVSPDLDIVEVRALMEQTAVDMWQDKAWHDVILERPEVWGVQDVTSDSVTVRVIARTAPLRQWEVGRELREHLKVALAGLAPGSDAEPTQLTAGPEDDPLGPATPAPGGTGGTSSGAGSGSSAPAHRGPEAADEPPSGTPEEG